MSCYAMLAMLCYATQCKTWHDITWYDMILYAMLFMLCYATQCMSMI